MPLIRDTIDPLREREVSDEEYLDLSRQGLVLTGTRAHTPEGLRAAAVRQVEQRQAEAFAANNPAPAAPAEYDDPTPDPTPDRDGDVEDPHNPAPTDDPQES